MQKGAVEGMGTNYLVTSTRYLALANICKFLSRFTVTRTEYAG